MDSRSLLLHSTLLGYNVVEESWRSPLQVGGSDLLLDCCILYSVKLSMDSGHYTITLDIVRLQWSGGVVVQSPTSWRERSPEYRTAVTMEWRSRGAVPYKLAGAVPRVQDCCKLYLVKLSMDSSHYTITLDIVRLQCSGGVVAQSPTSWRERSPEYRTAVNCTW
ncbi:hypothetical protein J6590_018959 [Homalodisca vitripennis]|nr:hypothetical protein J6590_018959 [Homalodisca vitripennis]